MTNAGTSTRDAAKAELGRSKAGDDSHWRLAFADDEDRRRKRRHVEQVEYVPSYEMLPRDRRDAAADKSIETAGGAGRRSFGMAKKPQETVGGSADSGQRNTVEEEEEEETEEATATRRAAERKADHANLKKMKGLSSLSGQPITNPGKAQKRKSTDSAPSSSTNKKKSKR